MGVSRKITETQLSDAQAALEQRGNLLKKENGVDTKLERDPVWRSLNSKVSQIRVRLKKIGEVEALNVELARLKEENLAKKAAAKAEKKAAAGAPKAPKEKPKAEGKPAAKKDKDKGAAAKPNKPKK